MLVQIVRTALLLLALASCAHAQVRLEVTPQTALFDEPVEVTITGLEPGEQIDLVTTDEDAYRGAWRSKVTFRADEEGRVSLAEDAPIAGDYRDVAPMGFIFSMEQVSEPEATRAPEDSLHPVTFTLSAQRQGEEVASARLLRRWKSSGVSRQEVSENGVEGVIFRPEGEGPFPSVVVLGGSEGSVDEYKAALLASHGYATFALAYFDYGKLPNALHDIPLEYFGKALNIFSAQPEVDPARTAILGTSRGGELALLLGATYPEKVAALIALVPSGVVVGSPSAYGEPAWTLRGEPVPYLTASLFNTYMPRFDFWMLRDSFDEADYEEIMRDLSFAETVIPIEQFGGPVLVASGTADRLWPSSSLTEVAEIRLRQQNYPHPFEHLIYEDAGHALAVTPYIPMTGSTIGGGSPQINAEASIDMWRRVKAFLSEALQ